MLLRHPAIHGFFQPHAPQGDSPPCRTAQLAESSTYPRLSAAVKQAEPRRFAALAGQGVKPMTLAFQRGLRDGRQGLPEVPNTRIQPRAAVGVATLGRTIDNRERG